MCGVAAVLKYRESKEGLVDEISLQTSFMSTRGPDGEGIWVSRCGYVGLGHRRLSLLDLSENGAQPMTDPSTGNTVVFNGEIYNWRELRTRCQAKGARFLSESDTEILLHLYRDHGVEMCSLLRGMFAFIIWDASTQTLFLARDTFGIKPLYIADSGTAVRVSSQVRALMSTGLLDSSPDPVGHLGFFLWGHVPGPRTMFRAISEVPPGTYMQISRDGTCTGRSFGSIRGLLSVDRDNEPRRLLSERAAHLRQTLLDSVTLHLAADVPVCVFLSSGRDSTTLLGLAAEAEQELRTITLGFAEFRGTPNDEVPLAEMAARQYGADHHTIWISENDFNVFDVVKAMDQPSVDGVNTYLISSVARRLGVKAALSGIGGDEIFGGYSGFAMIPRVVAVLKLLSRILPRRSSILSRLASRVHRKLGMLLELHPSYGATYLVMRCLHTPTEVDLIGCDVLQDKDALSSTLENLNECTNDLLSTRSKISTLELSWYMRNQLLRDADWAGMSNSLEIRVPFVDTQVVREVCTALPAYTKAEMAKSPRRPLPTEVLRRKKTGFQVPVARWLARRMGTESTEGLRPWSRFVYDNYLKAATEVRDRRR